MLGGLRGTPLTGLRGGISGDRVHKLARLLDARDRDALYHAMISVTSRPETLVRGGAEPHAPHDHSFRTSPRSSHPHPLVFRHSATTGRASRSEREFR